MLSIRHSVLVIFLLCDVMVVLSTPCSEAAEFHPLQLTDDNGACDTDSTCSLREAIIAANSNGEDDTIYLAAGTYTLSIGLTGEDACLTGDLDISTSLVIIGKGPGVSIVDADGIDRVFHVLDGTVKLRGFTITGGGHLMQGGDGGGGILCEGGFLYIESCVIHGNTTGAAPKYGGGVNASDEGLVSITDTTISDCSAPNGGGAIACRGSIAAVGLYYSTVTGNTSDYGGAIYNESGVGVVLSTISDNHTSSAFPGLYNQGDMVIQSSTLFQPMGFAIYNGLAKVFKISKTAVIGQCAAGGPLTSYGGNLESSGDTCSFVGNDLTSVPGTSLLMEPLAYNGGPTRTHRFGKGSVAIDAEVAATMCGDVDQRHLDGTQDGNGDGDPTCDIGAIEYHLDEIFVDSFEGGFTTGWSSTVQ